VSREVSFAGGPAQPFLVADGRTARELLVASDAAMHDARGSIAIVTQLENGRRERSGVDLAEAPSTLATQRARGGAADGYANIPEQLTRATHGHYVGEGRVDGAAVWVIWYEFKVAGLPRTFEVWRTEWIDQATLRLVRQFDENDDGTKFDGSRGLP
jgi:hypothetical protein